MLGSDRIGSDRDKYGFGDWINGGKKKRLREEEQEEERVSNGTGAAEK